MKIIKGFNKKAILPILLSLFLFIASFLGAFSSLHLISLRVTSALLSPFALLAEDINRFTKLVGDLQGTQLENEELKEQVLALQEEVSLATEQKLENDYLHQLTNTQTPTIRPTLLAKVIRYENVPESGYVYVDVGGASSVERGAWVTYFNNIIGQVSETYGSAAKVKLITSSGFKQTVTVGGELAELTGVSGLYARISGLRTDFEVRPNLAVVLYSEPGDGMSNYLFGRLSDISQSEAESSKVGTLSLDYDINDLSLVQIVLDD